jgi:RNA polymerase sigma factor (sigma-70 family)
VTDRSAVVTDRSAVVTDRSAVEAAIIEAHRREWAFVVAATVRVACDLDLAEECVQEAYAAALQSWTRDGVPTNPAAWLTTTAKRRAVDAIRRDQVFRSKLPLLIEPEELVEDTIERQPAAGSELDEVVRDERLRLIFLCCHPALARDGQVALTLRLVCGLSTSDIARAFLVSEATMAARITRATRKIAGSRIPYRLPRETDLPERLDAVLGVIYLLFSTGYAAPSGPVLVQTELIQQSLELARILHGLMPDEPEVAGLTALLLVIDARRATRVSVDGELLRLEQQDRSRWDRAALTEAHELIMAALAGGRPGRYVLQAAIASVYAEAPSYSATDWSEVLALYDRLLELWPSPVVALNRSVALSQVAGPAAALEVIEQIETSGTLTRYQYLPAVKADLLRRLGRIADARSAYEQAFKLADNQAERDFLTARVASLR